MAAVLSQRNAFVAGSVAQRPAVSGRRVVRVCCSSKSGEWTSQPAQVAAAAFAVAAFLQASPVNAGVVFQKSSLKKVLFDDSPAAPILKKEVRLPGSKAPAAAAPAAAKPAVVSSSSGGLDPKIIALPGAIVAIAGGAFALTKVDEGFIDMFNSTIIKDNNNDGVGYEPVLKTGNGISLSAPKSRPGSRPGTTRSTPKGTTKGTKTVKAKK